MKGGAKLTNEHYDITLNGDVEIINARLEHEGTYSYVAFFQNDTVWQQDISVIVTGKK